MTSRFFRDDGRHFKNEFEDYSPATADNIVDINKNDIHDEFKETLKEKIIIMLNHLNNNKKQWINQDDSSIYTGNTGIAYLYYFYGTRFNEETYIKRALELIDRQDSSRSKRDITFLIGEAGRLALGAVIFKSLNDEAQSESMITKLLALFNNATKSSYDELLYGRAGYLYALLFVNKHIPNSIDDDVIKKIIYSMLTTGKAYAKSRKYSTPLMYIWHDSEYLGGAHGLAGILYILLQARQYLTQEQLKNDIEPSIDYLVSLKYPTGNFPSSVGGSSDKLVHWCHGAPSMTMLFALAHEVFARQDYLEIAKDCGEVVWCRGLLKKGSGICHGVSGNAYTFLCLYQKTKELKHLYRACKFAEWCFDYEKHQARIPDRPYSLFEGLAGIIYYLIDLTVPSSAKFPGYDL
ncbi:lanC-like protein 2 [Microplitis mediator]|uniref:lanC-like protein 2 n=1 Tax=Microplitis mediator TaxID=375433 RepID=UPI0025540BD5|nr:lanC-like protein 2 [Microplitis mediator]